METQDIIRSKLSEYRMLESQMQEASAQLEAMENAKQQLQSTILSIQNIQTEGSTILPLGSGVFTKAQIDSNMKFIVQVGNSILIEKDKTQSLEFLNKRLTELQSAYSTLRNQADKIYFSMNSLEAELNSLSNRNPQ